MQHFSPASDCLLARESSRDEAETGSQGVLDRVHSLSPSRTYSLMWVS